MSLTARLRLLIVVDHSRRGFAYLKLRAQLSASPRLAPSICSCWCATFRFGSRSSVARPLTSNSRNALPVASSTFLCSLRNSLSNMALTA